MKYTFWCVLGLVASSSMGAASALAADYSDHAAAREFSKRMVQEHGFSVEEMDALLVQAQRQQKIIDAISRPAEKTKPWYEYRNIFLDQRRIDGGVAFWREHAQTLQKAEQVYGVPPEVVTAIIGVETRYGKITGSYRVLDALATLGFDYPPRSSFFNKELEHFLLLAREQGQDPTQLKGSYAGAMGYGQFMPSSYRAYAADFDGDGKIDIWHNPVDAIGSVANYFHVHGWQRDSLVMLPAKAIGAVDGIRFNRIRKPDTSIAQLQQAGLALETGSSAAKVDSEELVSPLLFDVENGQEHWLGLNNFYVITRYNRSPLYARAVWELAQAIKLQREQQQ